MTLLLIFFKIRIYKLKILLNIVLKKTNNELSYLKISHGYNFRNMLHQLGFTNTGVTLNSSFSYNIPSYFFLCNKSDLRQNKTWEKYARPVMRVLLF